MFSKKINLFFIFCKNRNDTKEKKKNKKRCLNSKKMFEILVDHELKWLKSSFENIKNINLPAFQNQPATKNIK